MFGERKNIVLVVVFTLYESMVYLGRLKYETHNKKKIHFNRHCILPSVVRVGEAADVGVQLILKLHTLQKLNLKKTMCKNNICKPY